MTPFAQYQMPLHYAPGILREHLHTRAAASLFDVSHMGQQLVQPLPGGAAADVARALESLMPADLLSMQPLRQRYAFLTTPAGGIRDDLMVVRLGASYLLIVNAACKAADAQYLGAQLSDRCRVEPLTDRVLLALQGPHAAGILSALEPRVAQLRFLEAAEVTLAGSTCLVTRSGYTGEDGFEISAPAAIATALAQQLLSDPQVELAGLGARDSLRLEAGLCLYGSDLDASTTPVQAALEWAIPAVRRTGGERAGGFPGDELILQQLAHGASERRVGLRSDQRPVRAGALLYADESAGLPAGRVTSGGFGPSLAAPVALGYVPAALAQPGTRLYAQLGAQRYAVTVSALPFVEHRYRR
jgi:aminomethyltransferase